MISQEILQELGIEWVSAGKDGRNGYFRRIAPNRKSPSLRQAEHRLLFSETSHRLYMNRGTITTHDGRQIPRNAHGIERSLLGTGQPKQKPSLQERLLLLVLKSFYPEATSI